MYIQHNACRNDPKLPFPEFTRQALSGIDSHPVQRVVIDLRQNGGGDSRILGPLTKGLASRLRAIGPIYVLIGPGTFSSASTTPSPCTSAWAPHSPGNLPGEP
jgi:hypothetical protein